MTPAQPSPEDEARRLEALRRYAVLDTLPEQGLDDLTKLAAEICKAPVATITLVDGERQWFKSKVGLEKKETARELSFCARILNQKEMLIVPDATKDERFAKNPLVTEEQGIRFYAGASLVTPEGEVLGALCVIDRVPRKLSASQKEALWMLSRQVMAQLELRRQTRELNKSVEQTHAILERSLWLATFPERNPNPIVELDAKNGVIHYINPSAERLFPDLRKRGLDHPLLAGLCEAVEAAEREPSGMVWRENETKNGLFSLMVTLVPETCRVRVYGSDITARKEQEREVSRLSRLYAALSQINHAIVRLPMRDEMLRKICRVLVEQGGYDMVWIGWRDAETLRIIPVAEYGDENGYLQSIQIYTDDRPEGRGPSGMAFREGRPFVCNDMLNDPATLPWRAEVTRRGWRASAAFPIRMHDEVCGTLTIYANEVGIFRDKEIELLEEAAGNISFALENIAREDARRQAEAVARSEKLFSDTMIESMPGILYFYDDRGRFLRWNRNFETVSGYTGEEIARMQPLDFFAGADKGLLQQRIGEVFMKGESSAEAPFLSKEGRTTPYFFTGRRVMFEGMECLVGMGIDISERKEAENRLAESERKYRELVEHANSIILRWNSEGRVTLLNEFGQRFFGYSAQEIIGRHVLETIVPATESSGRDLQQLMEGICADPAAFEQNVNENVRRNGEKVWISWTNRIERDEQGRVIEILSIGTDITERLKAEQAVRELNASLEQRVIDRTAELQTALVRAEAADRLKSAFLATMSHELRTPLNSIIGFTGTVLLGLPGPLNDEQKKQLGMVRSSARHLLDLINDVLDLSKIEAGQLQVRAEPFNLRASLEQAIATVQPLADRKGLTLSAVIAPEIGEMLSDRRRVGQILLNLLNNAIKFTDRGGVTLTATLAAGYRSTSDAPPQPAARIAVADTGMGIKPENLATLFQPFRQLDIGLSRQHEGTGLGLVICRRLAALLGGGISVTSEWERGSEFTVTLPLQTITGP